MLGNKPNQFRTQEYVLLSDDESQMMTQDRWAAPDTARMPVSIGENVRGNIYYNSSKSEPAEVVIWLHPYSYHSGYNEGYGVQDTTVYHRLAKAGYVVLAFDQCGFGLRLLEGRDFYDTQPTWSKLGRMVDDVHAAVDFFVNGRGISKAQLPAINSTRIHLLGFALGGNVALHAAALDDRISSVASIGGFTPLRTDNDAKRSGRNTSPVGTAFAAASTGTISSNRKIKFRMTTTICLPSLRRDRASCGRRSAIVKPMLTISQTAGTG